MDRHQELNGPAAQGAQHHHAPGTENENLLRRLADLHHKGPSSFINLSFYAFGLSGLWTAMGTPILPIKVEEILDNNSVEVFSHNLDKNGLLGIVSLVGLAVAAMAQVISGVMSDRKAGGAKRLPFIMSGAVGMALSVLFLGMVGSVLALLLVNVLVQLFGNMGQGPANALIADHVSPGKKGRAAGALNLARVAGAGTVTALVLLLMSQYDRETAPYWLWISLVLMATVTIIATSWTVSSLRAHSASPRSVTVQSGPSDTANGNGKTDGTYIRFLVALGFVISAMSALQIYSFFYLEDVIGLDNASQGALLVLVTTGIATALTVLPAGKLTDSIGRVRMLYTAAALGVLSSIILMFARSVVVVALDGVIVGIVIGIFLTVSWAVANDLIQQRNAARDLGYASIAVFAGSAIARVAGVGVDRLNDIHFALGYQVVLISVAAAFVIAVVMMTRMERIHRGPSEPGDGHHGPHGVGQSV